MKSTKGLTGVVADYTAVSKVNPDTNSLLYRGSPVQELAAKCSFEEVANLLWNGELPTEEELERFKRAERAARALEPRVKPSWIPSQRQRTPWTSAARQRTRQTDSLPGEYRPVDPLLAWLESL